MEDIKTSQTYTIKTLKDIFDNVPTDKIPACMGELASFMVKVKLYTEQEDVTVTFPEEFQWIDDDKNEVTILDE